MDKEIKNNLGIGQYTSSEAALILSVRPETLNRWIFGSKRSEPVLLTEVQHDNTDKIITFNQLIQALAVQEIVSYRNKVTIPQLRNALINARDKLEIDDILARKHKLALFDGRLVINYKDKWLGMEKHDIGQQYITHITELFMEDLDFDKDNNLAKKWIPQKSDNGKYQVIIDPKYKFGHPYISPSDIKVQTLVNAYFSEGSFEAAADSYEVDAEAIKLAIKYDQNLYKNAKWIKVKTAA